MIRPLRLLVVDDNPQDRRLVIHELSKVFPNAVISEAVDQSQLDKQIDLANKQSDLLLDWNLSCRNCELVSLAALRPGTFSI